MVCLSHVYIDAACTSFNLTELQAADLQNVTLTKLRNRDSKSVYRIDWSYENDNPLLNVKSFEVLATQIDPERSELPVLFAVTNPNLRSTEIELAGGDTYSICVETHFVSLGLQPQKSKDIKITTPPDNDGNTNLFVYKLIEM